MIAPKLQLSNKLQEINALITASQNITVQILFLAFRHVIYLTNHLLHLLERTVLTPALSDTLMKKQRSALSTAVGST